MSFGEAAMVQVGTAEQLLGSVGAWPPAAAKASGPTAQADAGVEVKIIQRAQCGDPAATAELYERHARQIFRYCLARVSNRAVAEDLTADVFLKMLEGLPDYRPQGIPFVAWLYRIAHARIIDYRRRQAVRQAEALTETLQEDGPTVDDQVSRDLRMASLAAAISTLSPEQQVVVRLRFVEGYNLNETAQRMGKPIGAIKAMQLRALRQLTRSLGASPLESGQP